jgi:hypothetical protein
MMRGQIIATYLVRVTIREGVDDSQNPPDPPTNKTIEAAIAAELTGELAELGHNVDITVSSERTDI